MFAVTDLFIVGTALDLVGGFLIAKGLLISPRTIASRASTIWGSNAVVALNAIEDKADAQFGLASLGLGFSLQAAGYFVTLLNESSLKASSERAFIGVAMGIVAAAVVVLAWSVLRPRIVRRNLLTVARWADNKSLFDDTPSEFADPATLSLYARVWRPGPEGETDVDAIRRVFGTVATRRSDGGNAK